jgi:hypothetical protein
MARTDADFAAYVAARWASLVRTVVLIGCPRSAAADVVLTGLARCSDGWDRLQRSDDVEVHVHRTVLIAWHHRRRHDSPAPEPAPTDEVAEVEPLLAELSPEQRETLVLRVLAGLDPDQVADVLDVGVDTVLERVPGAPSEELVRVAAASIEVPPPAYDDVAVRARSQRRRRRRVLLASVTAGLVVVGLGAWAGAALSRESVRERSAHVERVLNPAGISWYAAGRLHLREVVVEIPGITDLVGVGETVVYLDEDGIVGQVGRDGTVLEVGVAIPGSRLLGSIDQGWAAWVEPGDPVARLVVWDVTDAVEVGGIQVEPTVRPIAIDGGMLLFDTDHGGLSWAPPDADPEELPPVDLLDQASGTRVFQRDERIEIVQPLFGLSFLRLGEGAQLSFGGRYVLSREPGASEEGEGFRPLLYDTRTGAAVESGVGPDEQVVAAAFSQLQQVVYLVEDAEGGGDDDLLVLRSCEPGEDGTVACQDVAPVETDGGAALFAE